MLLSRLASATDTASIVVLAVLGVTVFIAAPIARYRTRRLRTPIRGDGALCRRLRAAGHVYQPSENPKTRAAFAATRARLVEQMHRDGGPR